MLEVVKSKRIRPQFPVATAGAKAPSWNLRPFSFGKREREEEMEESSLLSELLPLAFNSGVVVMLVQLLKLKLMPSLRANYPWAIPIVASGLGFVASMVMAKTGVDITPIAGLFSGFAASGMFATVKELTG